MTVRQLVQKRRLGHRQEVRRKAKGSGAGRVRRRTAPRPKGHKYTFRQNWLLKLIGRS